MTNKKSFRVNGIVWVSLLALVAVGLISLTLKSQEKTMTSATNSTETNMTLNKLTPEEERVIIHKGTEMPFTGEYVNNKAQGTYVCKQCGTPLYRSADKFDSFCGWPSFDDEIAGTVKRTLDADGRRTEITCAKCGAHLGHVFEGEGFTPKNVRHCVNSISLKFIAAPPDEVTASLARATGTSDETSMSKLVATQKAYFAGGCFWGTEHLLKQASGVINTRVGYMGGHTKNPTYKDVCYDNTGHAETVEVEFDPSKTTYETLAKLFFEIHDPTQYNRQGPDYGDQYRSAVFYTDDNQKHVTDSSDCCPQRQGIQGRHPGRPGRHLLGSRVVPSGLLRQDRQAAVLPRLHQAILIQSDTCEVTPAPGAGFSIVDDLH